VLSTYTRLAEQALADEAPSVEEATWLMDGDDVELLALLQAAFVPRKKYFGRKVMVQVLNNVQNGLCPEDCGYCTQAKDSESGIRKYPMKSDEDILKEAEQAALAGASRYCLALSGRGPTLERTHKLANVIRQVKDRYPIEGAKATTTRSAPPTATPTDSPPSRPPPATASKPAAASSWGWGKSRRT